MIARTFACGGARVRGADLALRLDGRAPDLVMQIGGLAPAHARRVPDALVDALEIAAYAWAADLATPRGRARALGAAWRRRLRLVVPVRAPELWSRPDVSRALTELLAFVSDDAFELEPVEAKSPVPLALRLDAVDVDARAADDAPPAIDEVLLFSGGVDSTAGAVRAIAGAREGVALVTHDPSPRSAARLEALVGALAERRGGARVSHVAAWIQPRGGLVRERSQRTRAFLWAVLAAVVAEARAARRVRFYENGIVSFALPIAAQVLGARAPRTTHPRALHLATKLFSALGVEAPLENPFLWRTKTEVVRELSDHGALGLLASTMSCSRFARGLAAPRSCGLCSACIDRRFATLAAGAAEHDPASRYEVDLLVGARPPGPSRALVESYVRAAMDVGDLTDAGFFARFGEASRELSSVAATERAPIREIAGRIVDLHRRHAEDVASVLDDGIRRHARALRTGRLPKSCVLRMCLPRESGATPPRASITTPREAATTPEIRPIRLLHLSDFHFSARRGWDQDPVVEALARDVARLREAGAIDLVAITGDVADRGADAEYERARAWIEGALLPAAGVDPARLLVVPGNHDVDRGAVNRMVQALQRELLRGESQDALAEVLADDAQRAAMLRRHAAFGRFVEALGAPRGVERPWWSQRFEVRGTNVHVAGLCTSWMSWCDEDKGRLAISRFQLHEALRGVERADVAIALMHHPFDDLAEFDAREVREAVMRRCRLVLRGHLHLSEGRAIQRPDLAAVELAAGACYAGSKYPNAFHLVEIEPGGAARVHMRAWDGHDWIADRNAYRGKAPTGVATFALDRREA